jgi:hypothetical protein
MLNLILSIVIIFCVSVSIISLIYFLVDLFELFQNKN